MSAAKGKRSLSNNDGPQSKRRKQENGTFEDSDHESDASQRPDFKTTVLLKDSLVLNSLNNNNN